MRCFIEICKSIKSVFFEAYLGLLSNLLDCSEEEKS